MRAWKFVPKKYADDFEKGVLRIGTVQSYAQIEGSRQDKFDSAISYHEGVTTINNGHVNNPNNIKHLQMLGFLPADFQANRFRSAFFYNNTYIVRAPDRYAFCMSRVWTNFSDSQDEHAIFEISDIHGMAHAIVFDSRNNLVDFITRRVRYQGVNVSLGTLEVIEPDYFTKDVIFSHEREIRIIFESNENLKESVIYTAPSNHIAQYLRRIK